MTNPFSYATIFICFFLFYGMCGVLVQRDQPRQNASDSICVTNWFESGEMVNLRVLLISELLKSKKRRLSSSVQTNEHGEATRVALFGSHVTQTNIYLVSSIPTIESLCLGCCTNETNNIDEKAFLSLRQANNLTNLEIYGGVPLITEQMCEAIASLRQLKKLESSFVLLNLPAKPI